MRLTFFMKKFFFKYGYAPKGTSTIIYRSTELLHHQYFAVTEWPGGIYATPTLPGFYFK